jgi:hypothetical protein
MESFMSQYILPLLRELARSELSPCLLQQFSAGVRRHSRGAAPTLRTCLLTSGFRWDNESRDAADAVRKLGEITS